MPGQSRLDGNLGCLRVADFTHHDFIRVMTQDRAQTAGKGQPFFLVDLNLGNALNLIFHRVFDRNDLVFGRT